MHRFTSKGKDVTARAIDIICTGDEPNGENAGMGDKKLIRLLNAVHSN